MKLQETLIELRKNEKRKFNQSIDLLINLKGIDMKRDQLNIVVNIPNKIKDKKVGAFLNAKSKTIDTITEIEFSKYKDKKPLKNLVKGYDYFMASASLMPKVAAAFGKVLGPAGKMPTPQLGMITQETDAEIKKTIDKISTSIKIRMKEPNFKLCVGKEDMADDKIIENIKAIYDAIENALPKKKENIKNIMLKMTMTKPIKTEI